jgi:hypothetical protein
MAVLADTGASALVVANINATAAFYWFQLDRRKKWASTNVVDAVTSSLFFVKRTPMPAFDHASRRRLRFSTVRCRAARLPS